MLTLLYYQLQAFGLMGLSYLIGSNCFLFLYIILIHISIYFLSINIFLYVWFILSSLHYYIHTHHVKYTIVETNKVTFDEYWHILNPIMITLYLYKNNLRYDIYVIGATIFYIYLFYFINNNKYNKQVFTVGGTLTALFISLINGNDIFTINKIDIFQGFLSFLIYIFFSWKSTSENIIGRTLLKSNIAGCAFISEFLLLYYKHNKLI